MPRTSGQFPASRPLIGPNPESSRPAQTNAPLRGGLVSARPSLQSARGPTLLPSPTRARPSYHGDPRADPSCPGPAATGRLPLCKVLGDPGLERTSGRRIRSPSSAQPAGNCSHKNGFARQGGKVGKRDGSSSQHLENLSIFLCPFSSPRFPLPVSSCMLGVVPSEDYNYRNPRRRAS